VQKVYDNLDFQRGVQAFLNTIPAASLSAMREGLRSIGVNNSSVVLFESLMDSKSLFLTANTESVYLSGWLDLKDGPMVIESPPNVLGFVDDFWFHFVTDMGNAGRDQGKGGKYLILPPNIPAKDFWSLVIYDNQTRSELQTDQQFPSISSQKADIAINADASVDVYFGPKPPPGKESNWVQTWPGKGWNVILRLYGPLQSWFDKTWRPGEIEEVQ
jgi:hypothetical protein